MGVEETEDARVAEAMQAMLEGKPGAVERAKSQKRRHETREVDAADKEELRSQIALIKEHMKAGKIERDEGVGHIEYLESLLRE